jgi:hypothetical protein
LWEVHSLNQDRQDSLQGGVIGHFDASLFVAGCVPDFDG